MKKIIIPLRDLLLGILFYGIFTPLAFIFRVAGRDKLNRKFPCDTESYWTNHNP